MKRTIVLFSALVLCLARAGAAESAASDADRFWPQWRGPLATGMAPLADPPLTWSDSQNVKWKARIPGSGDSTPIVWSDKVFILTAVPAGKKAEGKPVEPAAETRRGPPPAGGLPPGGGPSPGGMGGGAANEVYQFVVFCLDRKTGNPLWQKTAREEAPHEGHQQNNTFASASPVTDGQVVLAYFGSRGLHCYDMDGNLKWSKDFGHMQTKMGFGEGASPALFGDKVVVYWDDESDHDFIAALDKQTGKELWRTPRDEATGWSTPLVVDYQGKPQVVVNATGKVRSYDLATGKEIWSCAGQTANAIPSPVASGDTVYVTSGFRGSALYAIRLGHTGDLTGTDAILWHHDKHTPYVPSPLLADDFLYVLAGNNNLLSCFDAKTGAEHYEGERLERLAEVYASPVASKDRVYVLGRDGTCLVLRKGPKLEVLATNKLGDKTDASMALAGKELFIRGRQNLYCIAEGSR
jgi:outer membrane protein assembly factor BamB